MTRCPKCKSNLAMPKPGKATAVIRCGRCRTEFSAEEILGKSEASTDPETPAADSDSAKWFYGDEAGPSEASQTDSKADEKSTYQRRRYYSRSRLPKNVAPSKPRRRRRKPKTKFTRGDFVKVILGALFAFPVAQLILWWGFHKDPFRLGKPVAQAIPLLVPIEFRGEPPIPQLPREEYVASPHSSLLIGQPFDFQQKGDAKTSALQKGMSRPNRVNVAPNARPAPQETDNDGTHFP